MLEKSDHMLFTNEAYLQYKDMKQNDFLFRQHFSRTQPTCLKDIDRETNMHLITSAKIPVCDNVLMTRGGNAISTPSQNSCPTQRLIINNWTRRKNSITSFCHI